MVNLSGSRDREAWKLMKGTRRFLVPGSFALGLAVALAAPVAQAQQTSDVAIEQEAIGALEKMGAHLRTLESIAVTAETTRDEITETGQTIELASHLDMEARRPDRLRVDASSDRRQRQYYYDGKTVTVFSPITGAYGVVEAPPTIRQMLEVAAADYDLELPLADLFFWGTEDDDSASLTDAFVVGPSTVGGQACDHYAFRQEGIDWQIWIRSEDPPLPCKLVITTTSEESRPRYEAMLRWETDAPVADSDFVFVPPDDAYQIAVQPVAEVADGDAAQAQ
jgi:hypothetical protein